MATPKNDIKFRRVSSTDQDIESLQGVNPSPLSPTPSDNVPGFSAAAFLKRPPKYMVIVMLAVMWYSTAVVAISSSKHILNTLSMPLTLCTCQFIVASLISRITANKVATLKPVNPQIQWLVVVIALSYTLGFIFTNLSFSLVNANFAETVKSAEPISSVLIGYVVLNEHSSLASYLTLLPICVGVAISCANDLSFDLKGFLFAALSNICFSGRAVYAKKLYQHPGSNSMDETSLFYHISVYGLLLLIPLALIFEHRTLFEFIVLQSKRAPLDLLYFIMILLLNGVTYSLYNLASYYVLARTNIITHAVLNVFRRVVIISVTSLIFRVHLTALNKSGVSLAVVGVMLFTYFKYKDK